MADKKLMGCMEKRDLLNQSAVSVESMRTWGDRYEDAGLLSDAVDFYEKAKATSALERLRENVLREGDFFLFGRMSRILGLDPTPREWMEVARQAEEAGKHAFAAQALLKANPPGDSKEK